MFVKTTAIVNTKRGPERIIQDDLIKYLEARQWLVMETHGNAYQNGFPDLYCAHNTYGTRWIEVKNPLAYAFTPAQIKKFPKFNLVGVGIWILTAATEAEYKKLWYPQNWFQYLSVWKSRRS